MSIVLGIDVSKERLDGCLLKDDQTLTGQGENSPAGFNQLQRWLKKRKATSAQVCLEATGIYSLGVAQFFHQQGYQVSVVNPRRIQGFAHSQMRRSKTDRIDAAVIAAFCRALQPEAWQPPAPAWFELRALVRQLDDLQQVRQQQVNRLESAVSGWVGEQVQQMISFIEQQIAQLKERIAAHVEQHPELKAPIELLSSIPGIGHLTACRLVAEIPNLSNFEDVRQVVAFVGLDPTRHESGRSVQGSRRISRQGRASLRAALYMPALVAQKHNPILRAFAARLAERGKAPKQLITAVMRKLLHLAYGILKSGKPFDPYYGQATGRAA